MLVLIYSPLLGRGVVYDGDFPTHVVDVRKMYEPESSHGMHLGMWMQGPTDQRTIPARLFPFREAYDEMATVYGETLKKRLTK